MADLESEISRLREELEMKEQEIQKKDNDLYLAGKFGSELLETNNNLDKRLETQTQENNRKVEALEQEIYSLKSKLETRTQMERSYDDEIENLKTALKREKQKLENFITTEHKAEISDLKKQIRTTQSEVEKAQLVEKQMKEKNSELDGLLAATHEQLEQTKAKMNETCSDELAHLYSEVSSLQNENMSLTGQLSDTKQLVERLEHDIKKKLVDLEIKDSEIEEKQCLATSYFNALEKSREEVQELRVELDMIKMECQDQKKKGNSLFSEVEDRRVEAEKTLISMKIELDSVKKQLQLSKENYHKLKMQMAGLLQMSCSRADTRAVQNLQSQLNQARSENTSLMARLNMAEQQVKGKTEEIHELMSKMSSGCNRDYADYLKALITMKENEIDKLKEDAKTERFQRLAEQDRVIQSEQKRYTLERNCEKLQAQNLKQSVKLEELQMKYEPEKCKKAKERVIRIEKLPDVSEKTLEKDDEKENFKREAQSYGDMRLGTASGSKTKLISDSYYRSLSFEKANDRKKSSSSKVTFAEDIDTKEISGNDSGLSTSVENSDGPIKENGRVRGRQRHNKVVKVKAPVENENDQCKTQ